MQMQVEVAEGRAEAIGILCLVGGAVALDTQPIRASGGDRAGEETGRVLVLEFRQAVSSVVDDVDGVGAGDKGADETVMRTEKRKRVAVPPLDQGGDFGAHAGLSQIEQPGSAMVYMPLSGMPTHVGRLATSYLIS